MANKIILGLVLSLLVAMGSFAVPVGDSGLDISGSVSAGVVIGGSQTKHDTGDDTTTGPSAWFHDDDYTNTSGPAKEGDAMRVDVNFKYEKDKQGAFIKLRSQPPYSSKTFVIDAAFGWTELFIPQLKLTGGMNMDAEWATWAVSEGNWVDNGLEGDRGLRLEILPLDGLSIGASFFSFDFLGRKDARLADHMGFTTVGAGYSNNDLGLKAAFSMTFNKTKLEVEGFGKDVTFWDYGAAAKVPYIMTDADVGSSKPYDGVINPATGEEYAEGDDATWTVANPLAYNPSAVGGGAAFEDHKYFEILGGGTYTGIDNLTLSLDFDVISAQNKLALDSGEDPQTVKYSDMTFALYGKYKLGALSLPLYVVINTKSIDAGVKLSTGEMLFRFQPGYQVTEKVNASLRLQYKFDAFENSNFKDMFGSDYKGGSEFVIRPRVNVNFGNGVSFVAYYNHAIKTSVKTSAADPDVKSTETVQLGVKYVF